MVNRLLARLYDDLTTAPAKLTWMMIIAVAVWAICRHGLFFAFYALFEITGARPLPQETRIDYGESILAPTIAYLVIAFIQGAQLFFRCIEAAGGNSLLFAIVVPRPLLGFFGLLMWPLAVVYLAPFAAYLVVLSVARAFGCRKRIGSLLTRRSAKIVSLDYARS